MVQTKGQIVENSNLLFRLHHQRFYPKEFKEDLHTYVCLTENQMQMKEYEQVLKSLERMDKKWHRNEEYWILRIRYYVELKQGKELKETLEQIQQEHIYLSAKGKEALAFWQE